MDILFVSILIIWINIASVRSVGFVGEPDNVSAIEGQPALLSCFLSEDTQDAVSWWKETDMIQGLDDIATEETRKSVKSVKVPNGDLRLYSLNILDVGLEDAGWYQCKLKENEEIKSGILYLTVLQIPSPEYPKCINLRNSYIVGSSVTLTCMSEIIEPPVILHWIDDSGAVITDGVKNSTYGGNVYANLTFHAKKSDIRSTFTCSQLTPAIPDSNSVCTVTNININYKPEIRIKHTDVIYVGTSAILFCQSFANPPIKQYTWKFEPMLKANEYVDEGQVFRLLYPGVVHNGTRVTCSGKNSVGEDSDTIVLNISNERLKTNIDTKNNPNENIIDVDNSNTLLSDNSNNSKNEVSLYVVVIIIVLIIIIVIVVVVIPVYYQCFCKTRTTTDLSSREIYQPTVFYDSRGRVSNSGLYDRSLPRLPSSGQYGHWRHSYASQVPDDLDKQGYTYIEERNTQNTL